MKVKVNSKIKIGEERIKSKRNKSEWKRKRMCTQDKKKKKKSMKQEKQEIGKVKEKKSKIHSPDSPK